MLSKAKVQGAEPLALLMVGSMERGTHARMHARTHARTHLTHTHFIANIYACTYMYMYLRERTQTSMHIHLSCLTTALLHHRTPSRTDRKQGVPLSELGSTTAARPAAVSTARRPGTRSRALFLRCFH